MKKLISILLSLAMVLALMPSAAFASTWSEAPSLSIDTSYEPTENTITATVTISAYTGLGNVDFALLYPKDKVTVESAEKGALISSNATVNTAAGGGTKVKVSWVDENGASASSPEMLLKVVFRVTEGTVGDVEFSLGDYNFTDVTGDLTADVNTGKETSKVRIPKAVPSASDYTITLPENPEYDGSAKSAEIVGKTAGVGAVAKIYYNGSETAPSDAGTYTVTFDVAEGSGYEAESGLAAGTFTIQQATPTISVAETKSVVKGASVSLDASITPAELPLTYESSNTSKVTVDAAGTITGVALTGDGKWADVYVKFAGNTNYKPVTKTVKVSVVDKSPVAITFNNAPSRDYTGSEFALGDQFAAASAEGGRVITGYRHEGNKYASLNVLNYVKVKEAGTYTVIAYYESATEYGEASATFTINKVDQAALNMTSAATVTYGETLTLTSAGGSGTGDVTYAIVEGGTGAASISGSTLTPTKAGTVKVKVQKAADNNYNAAESAVQTITISPKSVTITGLKAVNKEYDGDDIATTTGGTISGIINDDAVTIKAGTAKFADENAETGKTVTFTGYELQGADKDNYALSAQPASVTADITAKPVTITGLTAKDKQYDGKRDAEAEGTAVIEGKVAGDDLSVSAGTAKFGDKNVGTGKPVSFEGYSLAGADKNNYTLTAQPANTAAAITAKPVTITGVTAESKTYDGSKAATVSGSAVVSGVLSGDSVTVNPGTAEFDNAFAGSGKQVTFRGFSLSGTDAGNYSLSAQPASVNAYITAAAQVIAADKAELTVVRGGSISEAELTANITGAMGALTFTVKEGTAGTMTGNVFTAGNTPGTVKVGAKAAAKDLGGSAAAEYSASSEITFTVKVVDKTTVAIGGLTYADKSYDGTAVTPTGTLTVEDSKVAVSDLEVKYEKYNAGTASWDTVTGLSKDAGKYRVTYSVPDTNPNYMGSKSYEFEISKAVLAKPALSGTYAYTGAEQTAVLTGFDAETMNVSGNAKTNAGTTNITVSLKDTANYKWADDTTAPADIPWNIAKAELTVKPKDVKITSGDALPTAIEIEYVGLKGTDAGADVVSLASGDLTSFKLRNAEDTADVTDSNTVGTYRIQLAGSPVFNAAANYNIAVGEGTLTISAKSSGGYIPTVEKPTIEAGEGVKVTLSADGTKATITVEEGYVLTDVVLNGVSKGKVTEVKGLKTGDKLVVTVEKQKTVPTKAEIQAQLKEQILAARSRVVTMKNGKKAVKITWINENGELMDFDGVEIFRSTKRYSGYGKTPIYDTENEAYYNTAVKAGTKYYYKVRGYVEFEGEKIYTEWSKKAWRTVK